MISQEKENSILAKITFITSVGDFISFFAILTYIYKTTDSIALASSTVLLETVGKLMSYFSFPSLLNYTSAKKVIVFSQFSSGLLVGVLFLFASEIIVVSPYVVLGVYFLLVLCSQFFDAARELHSKTATHQSHHLKAQSLIMSQFFSAQFIGPIVSFILISYLNQALPLLLDAGTFLVAGVMSLKLNEIKLKQGVHRLSSLRPLKYILKKKELLTIFLIRGIGTKFYIAVFNVLVFSVVTDHLDIKLINSAWIYSLIGLGSFIPANFLSKKNIPNWLGGEKYGEVWVAFLALGLLLVSRVGFVNIPTISIAALLVFIGGIANGSVAVTTRSIRRKVCTDNEFAEIVAFENIFGFFIQSVTKYICLFLLAKQVINYESGIYISCAGILMTALLVASLNKKYGEFIYVR